MFERHRRRERGLELAIDRFEVSHATEHLRERSAASTLFQRIVMRLVMLARLGCEDGRIVERTTIGA